MSYPDTTPRVIYYKEHGGDYTEAGNYELIVEAPQGYRIVSAGIGLAEDGNSATQAAKFINHGHYPIPAGEDGRQITKWMFLFAITEQVNFVTSVICERSDEPDIQGVI